MEMINSEVIKANKDADWKNNVWSVSTIEEDYERELMIWRRHGLEEGLAEGLAEGRKEGLAKGEAIGEERGKTIGLAEGEEHSKERMSALIKALTSQGRLEDIAKVADDTSYLEVLYQEFGL